jgi:hypothetical protein
VRVAVSGSHSVGKSTLIAAFLSRHPEYAHEPEAFETLGDDIDLTEAGIPTPDGLRTLLEYTVSAVQAHSSKAHFIFERSPVDYLAYAAASGSVWEPNETEGFLATHTPIVKASIRQLDLVAYLPVSVAGVGGRRDEDERFREHVDLWLRRILLDDAYELLAEESSPRVVELPAAPDRQLAELSRLVRTTDASSGGGRR